MGISIYFHIEYGSFLGSKGPLNKVQPCDLLFYMVLGNAMFERGRDSNVLFFYERCGVIETVNNHISLSS